jgi:hypothetical protein
MTANFDSYGKKKSRVIRINEPLTNLFEDAQKIIASKLDYKPNEVPLRLATNKVVDWARLGRQFELNNKPKKKDDIADKVAKFMDKIT